MKQPPIDQSGKEYKAHICAKAKAENLCPPEHYQVLREYILRPFSDRFWDDGCPAPRVKDFKAHLDMKPNAQLKYRQPYRLSKFDEARLKFLYEEAEAEGKGRAIWTWRATPCVCYSGENGRQEGFSGS